MLKRIIHVDSLYFSGDYQEPNAFIGNTSTKMSPIPAVSSGRPGPLNEVFEDNTREEARNENEDSVLNDPEFHMPFPDVMDTINFDVNAIPRRPGQGPVNGMRPQDWRHYNRERQLTTECIDHLYKGLMRVPEDGVEKDPRGLTVKLMPHQLQALKWMKWREGQKPSGGILGT